jgi:hypothetical protein
LFLISLTFQDPNADTEWNDILRSKGILPPKEENGITEEDLVHMVEQTIDEKAKGMLLVSVNGQIISAISLLVCKAREWLTWTSMS